EPEHPYMGAWWPQGHVIGWEHTFTHEIRDFLLAIDAGTPPTPSFEEGLAVQQVLAAIEESADAKSAIIQVASHRPPTTPQPPATQQSSFLTAWFETVSCVAGRDGGIPLGGGCLAESSESGEDGRRELQGELPESGAKQCFGG
ncbi:hypothetical protein AB4Z38_10585, partial [Arthrobacter sp. 2RAF6]